MGPCGDDRSPGTKQPLPAPKASPQLPFPFTYTLCPIIPPQREADTYYFKELRQIRLREQDDLSKVSQSVRESQLEQDQTKQNASL